MEKGKALLIINPISGTLNKEGLRQHAEKELAEAGFDVTTKLTEYPGAAYDLALKGIEDGFKSIIAVGGDGTFHECAAACCNTDIVLGLIPCGSGNGFARHLGIPLNARKAVEVVKSRNIVDCDYGIVNALPFFCTMGVGFDATVSRKFAAVKRRGPLSYVKTTLQEYMRYHPEEYVISIEDKLITERALVVAICNVSQYGNNFYIAPKARIDDGLLDITIVHRGNLINTALAGINMLTGYLDNNTLIHTFRTSHATIQALGDTGSLPIHLDGEPLTASNNLDISCHHLGLKVYAPGKEQDFRPIITPLQSAIHDLLQTMGITLPGKF